ncbi:MAG: polysaccharide deacetylase family protein [Candidatus Eremiobacteraeota bacterium]|nr:polysaccharide deacetylase family protein [Candidatus Eremiobacteraeota bacterium]MBC5828552.1 polysaccharide deacetylase family protein [Candidatus Eremiobacteraeota bacterium]
MGSKAVLALTALAGVLGVIAAPSAASLPSLGPDEHALYGPYAEVWRVPSQRREIALTFDDGPFPFYTPMLLHALDLEHASATFFVVGRSAQEFPELVERIVASGDEIGNHTFNHYHMTRLTNGEIAYQIVAAGQLLERFTGHRLALFRPPFGRYDRRVVYIAHALGYQTIFWSDIPGDTEKDVSPESIAARAVAQATPGGIILLHSGHDATIDAVPIIIARLRSQGYEFVTVGRLLSGPTQADTINRMRSRTPEEPATLPPRKSPKR